MEAQRTAKTLIVLGSGGHTAEMLEVVKNLSHEKYTPRYYVLSNSDITSVDRVKNIDLAANQDHFLEIFRSRNVNQSYLTSIFTTILAILHCFPLLWRTKPDLILCNGPGTCVPVCFVAFIYKLLRIIPNCKFVFLESICRVKTLSLSGKLLLWITDLFVVQWPQLNVNKQKVKYFGKLT